MLGLAAAPEIATAVPSEMPWYWSPYCALDLYRLHALPLCSGDIVNDSALRSCHAIFLVDTMLSAALTTWNGCQPSVRFTGQSRCIDELSFSSKPVNGSGVLVGFDAPRKPRTSRLR